MLYGMKNSLKTVLVVTPDFITTCWPTCENLLTEWDHVTLQKELVSEKNLKNLNTVDNTFFTLLLKTK